MVFRGRVMLDLHASQETRDGSQKDWSHRKELSGRFHASRRTLEGCRITSVFLQVIVFRSCRRFLRELAHQSDANMRPAKSHAGGLEDRRHCRRREGERWGVTIYLRGSQHMLVTAIARGWWHPRRRPRWAEVVRGSRRPAV